MTLKSTWSIASDDENSRQSFLSDYDSEYDFSPPPRYPAEKHSSSILSKLSVNRNEPPMTRSRTKAIGTTLIIPQSVPKEQRQSTLRRSFDSFAEMTATLKNSLINDSTGFPKQESSNDPFELTKVPHSPIDGVNTLTDWFESCSIDEGKFSKNCLWPSRETNSHYMRPITSASPPNIGFGSHPFSMLQTSSLFGQSSSTTTTNTLFGQQQAQLWSRFRFAASTIRNNLWVERLNSTLSYHQSNIFTSSNNNNNNNHPFHLSDPSSMLSSSHVLLPSSPPQIVPSIQIKTPSSLIQESSPSLFRQRQITPITNLKPSPSFIPTQKEDVIIHQSSSKIFFTLTIFAVGLVLGYLLTHTLPPGLIRHCFFILWETCFKLSIKYFHLLCVYLQTIIKYFLSFTLT